MPLNRWIATTACATILLCSPSAHSLAAPPVETAPANVSRRQAFRDALAQIAAQYHIALAVEGEPNAIVLRKQQEATSGMPLPMPPSATADDRVRQIATYYDYTVSRHGNVFALNKKYTYPEDMPGITPQECAIATRELTKAIRDLTDDRNSDTYASEHNVLSSLVQSLTAKQWSSLQAGGCLPLTSALTPEQRQQAATFLVRHQVSFVLASLEKQNQLAQQGEKLQFTVWRGYISCPEPTTGRSEADMWYYTVGSLVPEQSEIRRGGGIRVASPLGTAPVAVEPPKPPLPPIAITLTEAVQRLNAAQKLANIPRPHTALTFTVDPALAAKPVTLIGLENASPVETATAIANLYGLRLQHSPNTPDVLKIARKYAPQCDNIADLPTFLCAVLPAPLLAALHIDAAQVAQPHVPVQDLAQRRTELMFLETVREQRHEFLAAAYKQLLPALQSRFTSSHTITPAGMPSTAATPETSLSFSLGSLSPEEQSQFVIFTLTDFCSYIDFALSIPAALTQIDTLCLTSTVSALDNNDSRIKVNFMTYDPQTGTPTRRVTTDMVVLPNKQLPASP